MTSTVAALVLLTALFHAVWNSLLKIGGDRLAVVALVQLVGSLAGLVAVTQTPLLETAALPYLMTSVLIHNCSLFLLVHAYKTGDFGQVYPIARGMPPLFVALAAVPLAGETLGLWGWTGISLIALGIMSLAFRKGLPWKESAVPVAFALAAGLCMSANSLIDGLGARVNGSAHGYAAWLFLCDGLPIMIYVLVFKGRAFAVVLKSNAIKGLIAGLLAVGGYWIVIWAMTMAPLGMVVALRQTSVIFAALISMVLLREGFGIKRLTAAIVVAAGVILLKLAE